MELNKLFIKQGWQCPICKTIYNPYIISCNKCNNKNNYSYSDKTITKYNENNDNTNENNDNTNENLKRIKEKNQFLKSKIELHLVNQNFIKDLNNSYLPYPPIPNEI